MTYGRYLTRSRHGTRYYARVVIPKHLRSHFNGRWELRKSTMTVDLQKAKLKALAYYLKCQNEFLEVEKMASKKPVQPPSDILILMEGEDAMNRPYKVDFDVKNNPEAGKLESEAVNALIQESKKERDEIIALHSDNPILLKALLRIKEIDENVPSKPIKFHELVKKFIHERQLQIWTKPGDKGIRQRTFDEEQAHVSFWQVFFGERDVHHIKQADITEAAEWLNYLPLRAKQKELDVQESINMAQQTYKSAKPDTKKIAKSTYNKYANVLRLMLRKANRIGAHEKDLSTYIRSYNTTKQHTKEPEDFTIDDLKLMFSTYGKHFGSPSKRVSFDARFWLPILAVFHGCRIEELGQLTVMDVKKDPDHNIDYLNVTDLGDAEDGKSKSTKNENSNRPVPIHPTVIKIGFLKYVAHLKAQNRGGDTSLFNLTRSNNGKYAGQFSKYFTKKSRSKGYIERCGVESHGFYEDRKIHCYKSFHSFRHTATSNLRQLAGETDGRIALAFGQGDGVKVESKNYGKHIATDRIDQRYEIIKKIHYPGVDFNKIHWKKGLSSDAKGLITISSDKK